MGSKSDKKSQDASLLPVTYHLKLPEDIVPEAIQKKSQVGREGSDPL